MASQTLSNQNTYSTKTLIGNWQEERDLFGNNYSPNTQARPLTTYNVMTSKTKLPAKEFRDIQSAGHSKKHYSNQSNKSKFNDVDKSWSSLSLENKGPKSDNRFIFRTRPPIQHRRTTQTPQPQPNNKNRRPPSLHQKQRPLPQKQPLQPKPRIPRKIKNLRPTVALEIKRFRK